LFYDLNIGTNDSFLLQSCASENHQEQKTQEIHPIHLRLKKTLGEKSVGTKNPSPFPTETRFPDKKKNVVLFLPMVCFREAYKIKKHPGYLLEFTPQLYLRKP